MHDPLDGERGCLAHGLEVEGIVLDLIDEPRLEPAHDLLDELPVAIQELQQMDIPLDLLRIEDLIAPGHYLHEVLGQRFLVRIKVDDIDLLAGTP